MQDEKRIWTMVGFAVIIFLFISTSLLSQLYENEILKFVGIENSSSKVLYVLVTIFAVVVAPVSTVPLIPIASHVWGWPVAGVLSVVGWVIGAQIAFLIARRFGKPLVEKLFSVKKLRAFENYFTDKNLFWTVVFLRMIVPVDVLSYALGLFSKINSTMFFFATLIGVVPFAFIFSYAGNLSMWAQVATLLEVVAVFVVVFIVRKVIKHGEK